MNRVIIAKIPMVVWFFSQLCRIDGGFWLLLIITITIATAIVIDIVLGISHCIGVSILESFQLLVILTVLPSLLALKLSWLRLNYFTV